MEATPQETPAVETPAVETPAASDNTAIEAANTGTPGEGEPTPNPEEPPPYEPNYGFKVHGIEKEMDEWARPLVKDKETEDFYRDIMTKVHGVEHLKQDREDLRAQNAQLMEEQTAYHNQNRNLEELSHYVNNGQLGLFFDKVGINKTQLLNYFNQLVEYEQMSPAQKQAFDMQSQATQQNYTLQQQNDTLQTQMYQQMHEQRMTELNLYTSRPEVSTVATSFDQRMGRQGAFLEQVKNYGISQQSMGRDVSVEEAVGYVMNLVGAPASPQAITTPGMPPVPPTQQPQPPVVESKPVIPKVPSSGKSPVKSGISSIADLKAARAKLNV